MTSAAPQTPTVNAIQARVPTHQPLVRFSWLVFISCRVWTGVVARPSSPKLVQCVHWRVFFHIVACCHGDRGVRKLSCAQHFRAMVCAQLTHRTSLRDLVACLDGVPAKPCQAGFTMPISSLDNPGHPSVQPCGCCHYRVASPGYSPGRQSLLRRPVRLPNHRE